MKIVLGLLLLAATAHAEPPMNKLGFRIGASRIPLADEALAALQIGIGVEHPLVAKLRVLAEYEWLWMTVAPRDTKTMPESTFAGSGHRTHLGLRRSFAEKRVQIVRFYADVEAGGGLGLYDAPSGARVLPHGFVGVRGGYQVHSRRSRDAQLLETELHFRAILVEHGVGFGGGLGFYWGD